MKKYIKKSLFTILSLSLIFTMFNVSLTQIVSAVEIEKPNIEGLELNKIANKNADGTYELKLEAYAEGKIEIITKSKPLDIVLVLDQSGSMEWGIEEKTEIIPIYKGNGVSTAQDPKIFHHVKTADNRYIEVRYHRTESAGFTTTDIWKTEEGIEVIPTEGPSSTNPGGAYPAVQFYNIKTIYTGAKRLDVLKKGVSSFVEEVKKNGGDHRVAVVGYAHGDKINESATAAYQNSELFIGEKQYSQNGQDLDGGIFGTGIQYAGIEDQYKNAFQSTTSEVGNGNLKRSINALTSAGATRSDLGMSMANEIFANDLSANPDREKVVIMFTDGMPTAHDKFSEEVANHAIQWANKMKAKGTKVFTVGVENSLDVNADPSNTLTNEMNRYMQYVSSNFPNATSLSDAGTDGNHQGKKFLSAHDEASLLSVFDEIKNEISSSTVTLDDKTQLVDFVSDYFEVTEDTDIKVFTQDYAGKDATGNHLWKEELVPFDKAVVKFDKATQKISVSGFDYSKEFIAENGGIVRGKRLILNLKVKEKDGFIGGQGVPTNKDTAGIYDSSDNVVEHFDVPKVNIDLDFDVTAKDKSVYVATKTGSTEAIFDADTNKEGVQFTSGGQVYDLDGINNAFVDIVYEIKIGDQLVSTYTIKAGEKVGIWSNKEKMEKFEENTPFTVNAQISHKGKTEIVLDKTASAQVYVFKPIVTTEDSIAFKGEEVNLKDHVKDIKWVCENENAAKPKEAQPKLSIAFKDNGTGSSIILNPDKHVHTKTTIHTISLTHKEEDIDYTNYAKFINANNHQEGHFKVIIVEGELKIEKTITSQYTDKEDLNSEQSFKFMIERRDDKTGKVMETYYQTIQFSANENLNTKSIVLKGLSKGYYTISEVSNWSWKYDEEVNKREDNYLGNGSTIGKEENSLIYIGDKDAKNTNGKLYFGSASDTMVDSRDESYPAIAKFFAKKNRKFIIGDVASAINKFEK